MHISIYQSYIEAKSCFDGLQATFYKIKFQQKQKKEKYRRKIIFQMLPRKQTIFLFWPYIIIIIRSKMRYIFCPAKDE